MEEIYDALIDLRRSIDTQTELQKESNNILRSLIGVFEETAQAVADLKEELSKRQR